MTAGNSLTSEASSSAGTFASAFDAALVVAGVLLTLIAFVAGNVLTPCLGDSPSVWTTIVYFIALAAFVACLCVYCMLRYAERARQLQVQVGLLLAPVLFFALTLPQFKPPSTGVDPLNWLLSTLAFSAGPLVVCVVSTCVYLQKRMGREGEVIPSAFFVMPASGGAIASILYPLVIEPRLVLPMKTMVVLFAYGLFVALAGTCLFKVWSTQEEAKQKPSEQQPDGTAGSEAADAAVPAEEGSSKSPSAESTAQEKAEERAADSVATAPEPDTPATFQKQSADLLNPAQIWDWIWPAAISASLTLAVTAHVSNDLSPLSIFWAVPLVLYLTSFVLAFVKPVVPLRKCFEMALPLLALIVFTLLTSTAAIRASIDGSFNVLNGLWLQILALFVVACGCHFLLADKRPRCNHFVEYCTAVAAGIFVGSAFNAVAALSILTTNMEYPLAIGLAGALLSKHINIGRRERIATGFFPRLLVPLCVALLAWFAYAYDGFIGVVLQNMHNFYVETVVDMVWRFLPALAFLLYYAFNTRQFRLSLLAILMVAMWHYGKGYDSAIYRSRNFFGCHSIHADFTNNWCDLFRGSFFVGKQSLDPDWRKEPLGYYFGRGPLGRILIERFWNNDEPKPPFAAIGLQCGTLAGYTRGGQKFTVYEIDPELEKLARNPFFFTYIFSAEKRKAEVEVVSGEPRQTISQAPEQAYSLLVVDLTSYGYTPFHLITKEALAQYLKKVSPAGMIAIHISNRYYDLQPVLNKLAAELGLFAIANIDTDNSEVKIGHDNSAWVLLSADENALAPLMQQGWQGLPQRADQKVWTDDFIDPLSVLIEK